MFTRNPDGTVGKNPAAGFVLFGAFPADLVA
jgi:hypothetical protein